MMSWAQLRLDMVRRLRPLAWQRTLALSALIGVLGALSTIGFREFILFVERCAYGTSGSLVGIARGLSWWQRMLAPAVGGVLAGLLLAWARRQPEQEKGGDYMEAVALGTGDLGARASLLRALSATATVASGGAIGREGPMVQLAALCGSLLGRWQKVPVPRRRLYVACGAAAGIATAYNAPIAGAMFVAEIVLRSLAMESLGPLIVAAVAANIVVGAWTDYAPVYHMPAIRLGHGEPTLILASLGLIAGFLAPCYLSLLDLGRRLFERWQGPAWQKLAAGGLLAGALSVLHPGVWGNGYSVVSAVLQGPWMWQALLTILLLKLLAVAATAGSGAVGGIFTPTLFAGAVIGALFGMAAEALWPGAIPIPSAVVVGMGAFLAACTHAPLMSILMLFEMTESYSMVVPLMAACVLGYSVSRLLRERSIYASANSQALHAPVLTMASDLLRDDPPVIRTGQTLAQLEQVFLRRRWQHVYVLDESEKFTGAVSLHDFAPMLGSTPDAALPWPPHLLRADYPRVRETAPLWQVLETFASHPGERLPVLTADGRLAGYVTKTDLVLIFRQLTGE
ncbi:ClcB-like voltage-gated chloride channel protein [Duganella hordei]|uniref:ClcB-like voltage-gated chloride channel protein n=1 Tax=Duganella hordei TaxID=2865934 RepID=UPI0030E879AF